MKKNEVVNKILGDRLMNTPKKKSEIMFAPSNIALCKYWGKRNGELNLPVTSSLSVSLGDKGATTQIILSSECQDNIILNNNKIELSTSFGKRLLEFICLFRNNNAPCFEIIIQSHIPVAAGMASSACGFAAVVLALNDLYGWDLSVKELSLLSRLGSGSACRSLWNGFVEWHVGAREDGMDSHGEGLDDVWPELCIGLLVLSDATKEISSREAMQRTITTSPLYAAWPAKVNHDLSGLKEAISQHDFELLGRTAESNAMTMHSTMLSAWPPVCYYLPETLQVIRQIWTLRNEGLNLYFTQDAGPNLKLLFLKQEESVVRQYFPQVEVLQPFSFV